MLLFPEENFGCTQKGSREKYFSLLFSPTPEGMFTRFNSLVVKLIRHGWLRGNHIFLCIYTTQAYNNAGKLFNLYAFQPRILQAPQMNFLNFSHRNSATLMIKIKNVIQQVRKRDGVSSPPSFIPLLFKKVHKSAVFKDNCL